jgi:hypothetical protein
LVLNRGSSDGGLAGQASGKLGHRSHPLFGETADGIDADREAAELFFMIQGLIGPILIGVLSPADALALVDHQLDRIFR